MFLIDVSPSMGTLRSVELPPTPNGEQRTTEMTNLEWALQFVKLKIQEMVHRINRDLFLSIHGNTDIQWSQDRPMRRHPIWLRGCATIPCTRHECTDHILETDNIIHEKNGGYQHVSEYIPIAQPNSTTLAKLDALQPSENSGDRVYLHIN